MSIIPHEELIENIVNSFRYAMKTNNTRQILKCHEALIEAGESDRAKELSLEWMKTKEEPRTHKSIGELISERNYSPRSSDLKERDIDYKASLNVPSWR